MRRGLLTGFVRIIGIHQCMDIHALRLGPLSCRSCSFRCANNNVRPLYFFFAVLWTCLISSVHMSSHIPQTYFLSLLLSVLTSLTPAYALGPPSLSSVTLETLSRTTVFPLSLPIKAACFLLALVEDEALKGKEGSSANARVVRNDKWVRLFAELRYVPSFRSPQPWRAHLYLVPDVNDTLILPQQPSNTLLDGPSFPIRLMSCLRLDLYNSPRA